MPSLREALQSFSSVVVTGGSSGLGKSFIELMAKLNPTVTICNLSRRRPTINLSELKLRHFSCDLSRSDEVETASTRVVEYLTQAVPEGRVLLINNSGIGAYGRFPEPNLPQQLELLDINVRAVVHLTGLLLPWLKSRGGAIMTIASTAAFQPTPFLAAYGASKAFVLHWSLALNEELRGSGLRTLAVCPGPTATEFHQRAGLRDQAQAKRMRMSPEAVAVASFRALAAGRSQVVPGWANKVSAFIGSKASKPLAARIAGAILARARLKQVSR